MIDPITGEETRGGDKHKDEFFVTSFGDPVSPIRLVGTRYQSGYDDPPNQKGDGKATIHGTTVLSNENTTAMMETNGKNELDDYEDVFSTNSATPSAYRNVHQNELRFDYQKVQFKLKWHTGVDAEAKFPIQYFVLFIPEDDPDTPEKEDEDGMEVVDTIEWDGADDESPVFEIDPDSLKSGEDGRYQLLKVDLEWQTLDGKTADEDLDDQLENFSVPGSYSDYSTKSLDWLEGLRYFPGGENQNATSLRNILKLKVSIPGLSGQTVKLKAFDVDDTTPSEWNINGEIDDSDTAGDDNLDDFEGSIVGVFVSSEDPLGSREKDVTLDDDGEATVLFRVSPNPGSNYRVAATLGQFSTDLDALQVSDSSQGSYVTADDEQVSSFPGAVSPLLTTWRKLHIEVDSMDPGPPSTGSEKNFLEGTVASILANNVDLGIYAEDYDQDAFKGGRLIIDGRPEYDDDGFAYYEVSAFEPGHIPFHPSDPGETTNVDIIRTPESSDTGKSFTLYDDDDAYLEMVGIPDSLPKDDESDTFINGIRPKYAPAFIEVVNANNIGLNPNPRISFKLNEAEITVGNHSHFDDAKYLNDSTYFWAHTLVFGYQPETDEDYDPSDVESPSYGGTPKTGILKDQSEGYSVVYTEMFREFALSPKPTSLSVSTPSTLILYQNLYWNWALGTAAHEIGHSPGQQWSSTDHSEGGLMSDGGRNIQTDLSAKSLKRFRSSSSWSQ